MICYLPFTCISKQALSAIHKVFGPISLYTPDRALLPDHMLAAEERGDIELRSAPSLTAGGMNPAIQAYKEWADLHQGNLADMSGFFKTAQGKFPMMDETNPSQISTQVRRFEKPAAGGDEDSLFQAALFLSMAQDYDRQQDAMHRQLGVVRTMEQEMFSNLSGGADADKQDDSGGLMSHPPVNLEPGDYMTAARVEAWARLALEDAEPPLVYLTSSPAVLGHLCDLFPEAEAISQSEIFTEDAGLNLSAQQRCDALRRLAHDPSRPSDRQTEHDIDARGGSTELTFYLLVGVPPRAMLQRLCSSKSEDFTAGDAHKDVRHALIGLMALP